MKVLRRRLNDVEFCYKRLAIRTYGRTTPSLSRHSGEKSKPSLSYFTKINLQEAQHFTTFMPENQILKIENAGSAFPIFLNLKN